MDRLPGIAYQFSDPAVLGQALRHRSLGRGHNERLEYLGDAVLGYVVADALYRRYPEADEGELTRWRAALVNRRHLAELARRIGLGDHLQFGESALRSGDFRRDSVVGSALEAVIGAVLLDGGIDAARRVIDALLEDALASVGTRVMQKDPKTTLQEHLQALREPLPEYVLLDEREQGPQHHFTVECRVAALNLQARGEGASKKQAEQEAALAVLGQIRPGAAR